MGLLHFQVYLFPSKLLSEKYLNKSWEFTDPPTKPTGRSSVEQVLGSSGLTGPRPALSLHSAVQSTGFLLCWGLAEAECALDSSAHLPTAPAGSQALYGATTAAKGGQKHQCQPCLGQELTCYNRQCP